jgi:hypothetical protein
MASSAPAKILSSNTGKVYHKTPGIESGIRQALLKGSVGGRERLDEAMWEGKVRPLDAGWAGDLPSMAVAGRLNPGHETGNPPTVQFFYPCVLCLLVLLNEVNA